jgi:hypothetical protein
LAKEWGEFCVHNLISKALVEWSNVWDEGWSKEHITNDDIH